jgi:hypothetical protein
MAAPPAPAAAPPARRAPIAVELGLLFVGALGVRIAAAWALGEGAPFGPDGTGVEAAVALGGHLYPGHVALLHLLGTARSASVVTGALSCVWLALAGHRLGLSTAGGWLLAALPFGVYTGALSAGDAPALCVALLGVLLATLPGLWAALGGAVAVASVLVKPVALPALGLLLLRPASLVGVVLAVPLVRPWLDPLLSPMPRGGLLGTWWPANGGRAPLNPAELVALLGPGVAALLSAPLHSGAVLAPVGALGALLPAQGRRPDPPLLARAAGLAGALLAPLGLALMFGPRLEARYLLGAVVVALPWAGLALPRGAELLLLWPAAALVTQVAAHRATADVGAKVPVLPVVEAPEVDARALFDESSTRDATLMREEAARMAAELPTGATVRVPRRAHGRQGELIWPLRVARPDVRVVIDD